MPIQVQGPDGATIEFPDGTPQGTMEAALQAHYGKPKASAPQQPAEPQGETFTHGLSRGARDVLVGVASIPDIVAKPLATGVNALGIPGLPQQGGFVDMANAASDAMGLAKPENASQRIQSDVGRALSGTALTMGAGAGINAARPVAGSVVSRLGNLLVANPAQQVAATTSGSAAGGVARENGASPGVQLLVSLVGGIGPAAMTTVPKAALRYIARGGEAGRLMMQAVIDDFKAAGTTPTVGQATQRRLWRGVESLLAKAPGSSGVVERKAAEQGREIGAGVSGLAGQLSPRIDATRAGQAIDRGINGPGGFMERTGAKQEQLYGKLDQQISPGARVDVENTRAVLPELNPTIPGAPALSQMFQNGRINGIHRGFEQDVGGVDAMLTRSDMPEWVDSVRASLQGQADDIARQNVLRTSLGQKPLPVPSAQQIEEEIRGRLAGQVDNRLPYEAVKKTRTLVGREIADAGIGADVPRSKWNPLYGALSRDMEGAAQAAGPEAEQAWSRANTYTRVKAKRQEAIAHVVDKSGGPEAIFNAALSGTRDGATTLRALMRSLPKGAQKDVAAAVLQRMGKATSGQQNAAGDVFSSATFLTNWNRLSAEARSVLFDRFGPEFLNRVDAITRVASNLKDGSKVFANPSGTATTAAQMGGWTALGTTGLGALVGHPAPFAGAAGLMGGANLTARAMTSPRLVQLLANKTARPAGVATPLLRLLQQSYGYPPDQNDQ